MTDHKEKDKTVAQNTVSHTVLLVNLKTTLSLKE